MRLAGDDTDRNFAHVSAPGALPLLGHYPEIFGGPALYVAVELRAACMVQMSSRFMVNQEELDPRAHPYVRGAVLYGWTDMDRPLAFSLESDIPEGRGIDRGTASTVACLGAISMLHDHMIYRDLADRALRAIADVEGISRPLAVSASAYGNCVMGGPPGAAYPGRELWHLADREVRHGRPPGDMTLILARAGKVDAAAVSTEAKVIRYHQRNAFARDIVRDLGDLTLEGMKALVSGDISGLGECMSRSQKLLANLGAADRAGSKLLRTAARHSHGAVAAGAGGSGGIIALASDADALVSDLKGAGAEVYVLNVADTGARPEDEQRA